MKIRWDKKYLKISYHVIFTIVVAYSIIKGINILLFSVVNAKNVFRNTGQGIAQVIDVLLPVVMGGVIAYLLDPLVSYIEERYLFFKEKRRLSKMNFENHRRGKKQIKHRWVGDLIHWFHRIGDKRQRKNTSVTQEENPQRLVGTLVVYVVLVLIIYGFVRGSLKNVDISNRSMTEDFVYVVNNGVEDFYRFYLEIEGKLDQLGVLVYMKKYIIMFFTGINSFTKGFGTNLVQSISKVGSFLFNLFMGFVLAFYFLKDKERILKNIDAVMTILLPKSLTHGIKEILHGINGIFSGYIRGQMIDASIVAVLVSLWLIIAKVDFPIIIGIISGTLNIIPMFGSIIAFFLAILVALLNDGVDRAIIAGIGMFIIQQIDGFFIVPKVIGESVSISPALVLISLIVAGEFFGVLGMILSVPVCATLKLIFIKILKRIEGQKKVKGPEK